MFAWDVTNCAVHALLAWGCAALYCSAPDKLQKYCVLLPFICAALLLVLLYTLRIFTDNGEWLLDSLKRLAYAIEHGAVMFYILRLVFKEKLSCKNLSQHSPHFSEL